jgi:hypothetical protein
MSPTNYGGALAILIPATDQVKKNPALTESSLAPPTACGQEPPEEPRGQAHSRPKLFCLPGAIPVVAAALHSDLCICPDCPDHDAV